MKQFKKQGTFKSVCAFILAFMLIITNITGLVEVKAAGIPSPTINEVFYDATSISGAKLYKEKASGKVLIATVHVILKNGDTIKAELSDAPKRGTTWKVDLPENVKVEEGDIVIAYQQLGTNRSPEATANAVPSLASKYKKDLKMPTGKFWLEQFSSNIVSEDEKAEASQMLKDANPTFVDKIASVDFKIVDIGGK